MKLGFVAAVVGAGTLLAGCDRSSYESAPVRVNTPKGVVTCQLYTAERVLWDEAIAKPADMSLEEANLACENEGHRRLNILRGGAS